MAPTPWRWPPPNARAKATSSVICRRWNRSRRRVVFVAVSLGVWQSGSVSAHLAISSQMPSAPLLIGWAIVMVEAPREPRPLFLCHFCESETEDYIRRAVGTDESYRGLRPDVEQRCCPACWAMHLLVREVRRPRPLRATRWLWRILQRVRRIMNRARNLPYAAVGGEP